MALGSNQAGSTSTASTTERDDLPVGRSLLHGFPRLSTCVTHTASSGRPGGQLMHLRSGAKHQPNLSPTPRLDRTIPSSGEPFQGLEPGAAAKRPPCLLQDATSKPGLLACLFCFCWRSLDSSTNTGLGILCLLRGDAARPEEQLVRDGVLDSPSLSKARFIPRHFQVAPAFPPRLCGRADTGSAASPGIFGRGVSQRGTNDKR
jgi:hypothetical protein